MSLTCTYCGGELVWFEDHVACSKCGRVHIFHDFGCDEFIEDRGILRDNIYRVVRRLGEEIKIPYRIQKKASYMLGRFLRKSGIKARNKIYYAAAALVLASRNDNHVVTIKEVRAVLKSLGCACGEQTLIKKMNEIERTLGIKGGKRRYEAYIAYVLRKLDEDGLLPRVNCFRSHLPSHFDRIQLRALKIIKLLHSSEFARFNLLGKSPLIVSAAAVYIVAKQLGLRNITQEAVARAINSHKTVIRKRAKMLAMMLNQEITPRGMVANV